MSEYGWQRFAKHCIDTETVVEIVEATCRKCDLVMNFQNYDQATCWFLTHLCLPWKNERSKDEAREIGFGSSD